MVKEDVLKIPIVEYFKEKWFQGKRVEKFLAYEEPSMTETLERPDLVFVHGLKEYDYSPLVIAVEIENQSRKIERDPKHGVHQLDKCPGNYKYLAIPSTIWGLGEAENVCRKRNYGLLIVHVKKNIVKEIVKPRFLESSALVGYNKVQNRWNALCGIRKRHYCRIRNGRIVEQT